MRRLLHLEFGSHCLNRPTGLTCISSNSLRERGALNANKENGSLFDRVHAPLMYSDVLVAGTLQFKTAIANYKHCYEIIKKVSRFIRSSVLRHRILRR